MNTIQNLNNEFESMVMKIKNHNNTFQRNPEDYFENQKLSLRIIRPSNFVMMKIMYEQLENEMLNGTVFDSDDESDATEYYDIPGFQSEDLKITLTNNISIFW